MPAPRFSAFTPRAYLDQYLAHHAGSDREEVSAVLQIELCVRQSHPRLVDQRRRLKRMAVALARHLAGCDAAELVVDQGQKGVAGGLVPLPPFDQQPGDVLFHGSGAQL